jgi:hypothetical protein
VKDIQVRISLISLKNKKIFVMKKKNQKNIYTYVFFFFKCGGRGDRHVASILKPIWSTTKFALVGFDYGSMER